MHRNTGDTIVLGFPDYRDPARRLADLAGIGYADVEVHHFPDGESLVRLPETLPSDVVLYTSLDDANRRLVELEFAAATAIRLGASRLTLVAPYLCYMRQDSAFHAGEAISQRIVGALLARHFDTLITVDPHLHRTAHLGDAIPVRRAVALSAAPVIAEWLKRRAVPPLLIGPDEESEQWVRAIAAPVDLEYGVARKRRLGDKAVQIELPELNFGGPGGGRDGGRGGGRDGGRGGGRDVVLVDDVASTGRTLAEAASQILARGAASVAVVVSHALFVGDAIDCLRRAGVSEICSTDSILHPSNRLCLDTILAQALRDGRAAPGRAG